MEPGGSERPSNKNTLSPINIIPPIDTISLISLVILSSHLRLGLPIDPDLFPVYLLKFQSTTTVNI